MEGPLDRVKKSESSLVRCLTIATLGFKSGSTSAAKRKTWQDVAKVCALHGMCQVARPRRTQINKEQQLAAIASPLGRQFVHFSIPKRHKMHRKRVKRGQKPPYSQARCQLGHPKRCSPTSYAWPCRSVDFTHDPANARKHLDVNIEDIKVSLRDIRAA